MDLSRIPSGWRVGPSCYSNAPLQQAYYDKSSKPHVFIVTMPGRTVEGRMR